MRRALATAMLVIALAPGAGRADHVSGSILVATGTPVSDGNSRPARCAYGLDATAGQGVFGWVLTDVSPGAAFHVTAATDLTDVDIDFFRTLSPCSADPDKTPVEHDNHTGDEHGTVPEFASVAIVTLRNGPPGGASFVYHED